MSKVTVPFYQWFDDLTEGEQKKIVIMTEDENLAHPREYGSALDILLDIYRVGRY